MKKIMFNDKYGLTKAVIEGRKPMTRRKVKGLVRGVKILRINDNGVCKMLYDGGTMWATCNVQPKYKLGEVVAVAQSYQDCGYSQEWVIEHISPNPEAKATDPFEKRYPGWNNKMYVKAEYMKHFIRITDIKAERLQDISRDDALKEGVSLYTDKFGSWGYTFNQPNKIVQLWRDPVIAFAALIDKVSGKGTWESNLWEFAYTFELMKGKE